MPSIELVIAAFLLVAFLAAVLSQKFKVPYTLVLVLAGVAITVVAFLLSSEGGSDFTSQLRSIYCSASQWRWRRTFRGISGSAFDI